MLRRRPAPRRAPTRHLHRVADGALTADETGAVVTLAELRADLQAGRYFRAVRSDTGLDSTNEVLAEVIRHVVPDVEGPTILAQNPLAPAA